HVLRIFASADNPVAEPGPNIIGKGGVVINRTWRVIASPFDVVSRRFAGRDIVPALFRVRTGDRLGVSGIEPGAEKVSARLGAVAQGLLDVGRRPVEQGRHAVRCWRMDRAGVGRRLVSERPRLDGRGYVPCGESLESQSPPREPEPLFAAWWPRR